jgi:hypothetical protein
VSTISFPGPNNPAEPYILNQQAMLVLGRYAPRAPLLIRVVGPEGSRTYAVKSISQAMNEGDQGDQPVILIE